MKYFSYGRITPLFFFFFVTASFAGVPGSDLVSLIKKTAEREGLHVIPQTSKIRIWPLCDGKLTASPLNSQWETVGVECWDEKGLAWNAAIRTKIVGTLRQLNSNATSAWQKQNPQFADLEPGEIGTKTSQHDYWARVRSLNPPTQNRKPKKVSGALKAERGTRQPRYWELVRSLNPERHEIANEKNSRDKGHAKFVQVVKFRIPLRANTIIRETDLYISKAPQRASQLSFQKKSDIIGRKTRSHVGANIVVAPRHLLTRWDIYKGDSLTIFKTVGPIRISASGIALSHAQVGGRIAVKNNVSGRVLTGIVEKQKKVRIFTKQPL